MPKQLSHALTPLTVKNAKPGRHTDGAGLYLLVKDSGARSWVYRFMLNGKSREVGLGAASGVGAVALADARFAAAALRLKVKAGIDPLAERQQQVAGQRAAQQAARIAAITFRDVAQTYIAANEDSWRNAKHRWQWTNTLERFVYPFMGDTPVADVTTAHVMQALEPIWHEKAETASRVRGRIETILDAAKARGYREGENPARWRGNIAHLLPARKRLTRGHYKALPYDEVPDFMAKLRAREALAGLALEFTILTAARTGEVLGARWEEVDLAKAIWTIPAERMKAGKEHRVPLPPRAVEILEATNQLGKEWLFPSAKGGKLSVMAMTMLLRRMKVEVTVHGFRSAFRDWAAERTGFSHEVCEMALAHTIGNSVEAAYRRGDLFEKRRRLMAEWATYCASDGKAGADVTPIRMAEAG